MHQSAPPALFSYGQSVPTRPTAEKKESCTWVTGDTGETCDEEAIGRIRLKLRQADVKTPVCLKHKQVFNNLSAVMRRAHENRSK